MRNIFIDANSAYDSSISGTGLDTFTSVGSQIYRVSLGYKVPLQKQAVGSIRTLDRGISLFGSVGIYWQSLEAEVKPNLVQYSTYGNTISKKFLKPFFSIGGMYRLSKMFAFIGRVLYYQSAEETFWLQTEGVSGIGNGIGTGNTIKIKSINGIGLSIGFILNYPCSFVTDLWI